LLLRQGQSSCYTANAAADNKYRIIPQGGAPFAASAA
jgi:hypothetical protein